MYIRIEMVDDSDGCDEVKRTYLSNNSSEDKIYNLFIKLVGVINESE